jgi:hypothetical protein
MLMEKHIEKATKDSRDNLSNHFLSPYKNKSKTQNAKLRGAAFCLRLLRLRLRLRLAWEEDMAAAAAPLLRLCSSAPAGGCTEATLLHSLHSFSTTRINDISSSAGVTIAAAAATTTTTTRRQGRRELLALVLLGAGVPALLQIDPSASLALDEAGRPVFRDLDGSGDAVKALDIREGSGRSPRPGDKVSAFSHASGWG